MNEQAEQAEQAEQGNYVIPVNYLSKWYYQLVPYLGLNKPAFLAWSETTKRLILYYEGSENSPVFNVAFSEVTSSEFNLNQIELKVNGRSYNLLYRDIVNTIVTVVAGPIGFAMAVSALNSLHVKDLQTQISGAGGKVRKTNVLGGVLIGIGVFIALIVIIVILIIHSNS